MLHAEREWVFVSATKGIWGNARIEENLFLRAAKISLPIFLALTVLPLAIPTISMISFPGTFSVVEIIILSIYNFYRVR